MQRRLLDSCRRFGTTYRPHLQGPNSPRILRLLDPWRYMSRNVGKISKILRCVKSQNSADLIYIAKETWNHAVLSLCRTKTPTHNGTKIPTHTASNSRKQLQFWAPIYTDRRNLLPRSATTGLCCSGTLTCKRAQMGKPKAWRCNLMWEGYEKGDEAEIERGGDPVSKPDRRFGLGDTVPSHPYHQG